jgi:hypothetical protein
MVLYIWNDLFELVNPNDINSLQYPYDTVSPNVKILKTIPRGSYVKSISGEIYITFYIISYNTTLFHISGEGPIRHYNKRIIGIATNWIEKIFIRTRHIVIIQRAWRKYFLRIIKLKNDPIVHGLAMYFGHPSRITFNLE